MSFLDIALPMAARGVPITPVRPNTKKAFLENFQNTASFDPAQIHAWAQQYPNYNAACVAWARPGGVWFFEVDGPDVLGRIYHETGHDLLAEINTFRVRSRPGRGHLYFLQNLGSIAMGNMQQAHMKHGDWSARVENMYVVAPGSIHPDSGLPYEIVNDAPFAEAPPWLIGWMLQQKLSKQPGEKIEVERNENNLVPHGSIHGYMLSEAGRLRNMGLDADEIYPALSALVHKNCEPPIDESKVKTMAQSICNFPAGRPTNLILTGESAPAAPSIVCSVEAPDEPEVIRQITYPVFPSWVMEGTQPYEDFIKPWCEINDAVDYFMWLPMIQTMLNYLGTKVKVKLKDTKCSLFTIFIGRRGQAHKSWSMEKAHEYLASCGIVKPDGNNVQTADGATLIFSPGSPEGLGPDVQSKGCKNWIIYYDEFAEMIAKMGIEHSSMRAKVLGFYESAKFEGQTKNKKTNFSFPAQSYCASIMTCTTTKNFPGQWAQFTGVEGGKDSGMENRFMFVLQPIKLPERQLLTQLDYLPAAQKTRKLLDKAVNKGVYQFEDQERLKALNKIETRYAQRAERWALGIAVALGLDTIDEDCVERACAIVQYEIQVKNYLRTFDSVTREGNVQQELCRHLEMAGGFMEKRELMRVMNYRRFGTSLWVGSYMGLMKNGDIREEGTGKKNDPVMVRLMRASNFDDED